MKNFVFVGSAGAYDANSIEPLHVEGDKRKAKAGHVEVEKYLESESVPFTVFQPQYIYGPYTAKVRCSRAFCQAPCRLVYCSLYVSPT